MGASASDKLKPKLAVRTEAHKLQHCCVQLSVDQDEIGPNMAVPMVFPGSDERVVAVLYRKGDIKEQRRQNIC